MNEFCLNFVLPMFFLKKYSILDGIPEISFLMPSLVCYLFMYSSNYSTPASIGQLVSPNSSTVNDLEREVHYLTQHFNYLSLISLQSYQCIIEEMLLDEWWCLLKNNHDKII